MQIEQRAKEMEEGDCADPGSATRRRTALAQGLFHPAQEDVQGQSLDRRIVWQEIAQPLRDGWHPRVNWQARQNVFGKVRRGFHHPPRRTSRTDAAAFARVGDEKILSARSATGASKSMREDAAFEVAAKFPLDRRRGGGSVIGRRQPSRQMRHEIEQLVQESKGTFPFMLPA